MNIDDYIRQGPAQCEGPNIKLLVSEIQYLSTSHEKTERKALNRK